ncbi:hypothetical protein [uncultured Methylophaga sp.]|jgi:hypothetical protein|uniref:hypothetical protein n=1 Tax=uncultured Methylophaga sp. TaxID=285271 RepID=UPI0026170B26|nr:hypothetical protein [uncultured Methylophaga sp.]
MNENKGLLASICGFFKGLFSSSPAADNKPAAANDGLTGVERYIRNQAQGGAQLTGVEQYIRNQVSSNTPVTGVEQYVRSQSQSKPMTGVERYIQNKG